MTGESNTASNLSSSGGIGPFIQKINTNLEFRRLVSESDALIISLDTPDRYNYPDPCISGSPSPSPGSPYVSPSPYPSPSPFSPAIVFTVHVPGVSHRLLSLGAVSADDHQYLIPRTGARGFSDVVSGQTPTSATHLATKAYVDATGSDRTYVHNQISASTSWTVVHNLNKYPTVSVIDSGSTVVLGDITYNSVNQLTVTLSALSTGKVYCN
jgi:hypothetical protein